MDWFIFAGALIAAAVIFLAADVFFGEDDYGRGVVIDHFYTPGSVSTGNTVTADGKVGITTTVKSEQYRLAIRIDGNINEYSASKGLFYSKRVGDPIAICHRVGAFTGFVWSAYACDTEEFDRRW